MTGRINVAVAVTETARLRIHEVARACQALGLQHVSTLSGIGVLVGSIERCDLRKLWSVPEVLAIEVERKLRARALTACEA
jgi:hypothetical protein